jgi:hypothetical protein
MSMRSRLVLRLLSRIVLLVLLPVTPGALSQIANGIFVTPVPNAPFVAVVKLEQTRFDPDGTIVKLKTNRAIARDSQGRIYKDSRRLQLASESNAPPMIMIDLFDPQTQTYTFIYPQYRTFWRGTLVRPPSLLAREFFYGWPTRNGLPVNDSAKEEDLGTQTIKVVSPGWLCLATRFMRRSSEYQYSSVATVILPALSLMVCVSRMPCTGMPSIR